jgi:hypothetical protein
LGEVGPEAQEFNRNPARREKRIRLWGPNFMVISSFAQMMAESSGSLGDESMPCREDFPLSFLPSFPKRESCKMKAQAR